MKRVFTHLGSTPPRRLVTIGVLSVTTLIMATVGLLWAQRAAQAKLVLVSGSGGGSGSGSIGGSPWPGTEFYNFTVYKSAVSGGTVKGTNGFHINCDTNCAQQTVQVTAGQWTVTVTPATGWQVFYWYTNGGIASGCGTSSTICSVYVGGNTYVETVFSPMSGYQMLNVTNSSGGTVTSNPSGINCGLACSSPFLLNSTVTLSATPDNTHMFIGWSGDCTGAGTCTVTMDADKSVTATFGSALTVNKVGNGTVTSTPAGIDCGPTCAVAFPVSTSVQLTATPDPGWVFGGWSGCTSYVGGDCVVQMTQPHTITATFVSPTLTVSVAGFGTVTSNPAGIDCGSTCSAPFPSNSTVSLTATPNVGYAFISWSGACTGGGSCTVTMDGLKSVGASFTAPDGTLIIQSATLPTPLSKTGCAEDSSTGSIYCFGGQFGNPAETNQIIRYDPSTDTSTPLAVTLPSARSDFPCVEDSATHKIYCFGGYPSSATQIIQFDPATQAVNTMNSVLPPGFLETSCAENPATHLIYCLGGQYSNQIVEFNPATDSIRTMGQTLPFSDFTACANDSLTNHIFCFGGGSSPFYNTILEYDPVAGVLTTKSVTLPVVLTATTCAELPTNHRIYCFGGHNGAGTYYNSIWAYDPATNTVSTLAVTLPSARAMARCATSTSTGAIYCFGGENYSLPQTHTDQILKFYITP